MTENKGDLISREALKKESKMRNIASYQEGYTDGFDDGKALQKKEIIRSLYDFIREQKTEEPERPYLRGYNSCLTDLKEFIEDNLI